MFLSLRREEVRAGALLTGYNRERARIPRKGIMHVEEHVEIYPHGSSLDSGVWCVGEQIPLLLLTSTSSH